jgi:pimeloyl-ACP methyl ester carboxylesterase
VTIVENNVDHTINDEAVTTGYARTDDGEQLHWRRIGQGPPVVLCNGVGVSTFFWKYLVAELRVDHTVLLWDYRGHGRSARIRDPLQTNLSVERHADDCALVMAAAGIEAPAVVVGHSMGCQVALELRRRHPARVSGLVLALGTAGNALETFFDWGGSPRMFQAVRDLVFAIGAPVNLLVRPLLESPLAWEVATRARLVDPYYTRREDLTRYLAHLSSLDQRMFWTSVLSLQRHDAWGTLPALGCPLLVIAAENDNFTPMWCSEKMVRLTPGAELMVLADGTHAALVEQPETLNHRIRRFIEQRCATA